MPKVNSRMRVTKTMSPHDPGAIKLAQKFGDRLLCVRHRVDAEGRYRQTTVELIVDRALVQSRSERLVGVKIGLHEESLQALARAGGAKWDPHAKLWRMPKRLATRLGLLLRIKETCP